MTREKAIEVVKEAMPTLWKETKDAIQTLIPELAESEDERIRSCICLALTDVNEQRFTDFGVTLKDCLAYLKKQKEQKFSIISAEESLGISPEEYNKIVDECIYDEQKEQKPAEWSEEDNIGWDEAFACVTRAEKSAKSEEELQNAVTAEKWLKKIKFKYYVHLTKQEWSEEDEANITDNKKFFLWVYNRLLYVYKEDPDIDYMRSFRKRIDQLFSKPHWKPSEEQLKILKRAADDADEPEDASVLLNLCRALKKL